MSWKQQILGDVKNIDVAMKLAGMDLANSVKDRLRKQKGNSDGSSWKPLKESTKARKTANMRGKILIDKYHLINSINYAIQGDKLLIGSNVIYAKRHNEGTFGMPKREFLYLDNEDKRTIEMYLGKIFK